jgi:predicted DNA binding CopG/RHH family protein
MKSKKTKSKSKINYGTVSLPKDALELRNMKTRVTIMFDLDILKAAKEEADSKGIGYQTLLNDKLRDSFFGEGNSDLERRVAQIEKKLKKSA